jgi:hypothetical protein
MLKGKAPASPTGDLPASRRPPKVFAISHTLGIDQSPRLFNPVDANFSNLQVKAKNAPFARWVTTRQAERGEQSSRSGLLALYRRDQSTKT